MFDVLPIGVKLKLAHVSNSHGRATVPSDLLLVVGRFALTRRRRSGWTGRLRLRHLLRRATLSIIQLTLTGVVCHPEVTLILQELTDDKISQHEVPDQQVRAYIRDRVHAVVDLLDLVIVFFRWVDGT